MWESAETSDSMGIAGLCICTQPIVRAVSVL